MITTRRHLHVRRFALALLTLLTVLALAPFVHAGGAASPLGTWTRTGSLHQARAFDAAILLPNGQVLVAGGCRVGYCGSGADVSLASAELYNSQTGAWTATGAMHHPRLQYTLTLLPGGQVLAAGGCATTGCTKVIADAELYNPQTGAWTATGAMHHARALNTSTLLPGGLVLVTGGCGVVHCSPILASAELYNPLTGTWTATGTLHTPRARHSATLLPGGQVLVTGGCGVMHCSPVLASAELYNPQTGAWRRTGSMHHARTSLGMVLLHSGQVLVVGGFGSTGVLAGTELYNPSTGTWSTSGAMSLHDARNFQTPDTATLLPSGQVLVAGDGGGNIGSLASTELFNPTSRTWALSGSLHDPRAFQTTTLLANGQVLLAGGIDDTDITARAELYQP